MSRRARVAAHVRGGTSSLALYTAAQGPIGSGAWQRRAALPTLHTQTNGIIEILRLGEMGSFGVNCKSLIPDEQLNRFSKLAAVSSADTLQHRAISFCQECLGRMPSVQCWSQSRYLAALMSPRTWHINCAQRLPPLPATHVCA